MQILDRSAKDMILFSCGRVCCLITLLYQYLDLSLRPESHTLLRLLLLGEIQNDFAAFGYLFFDGESRYCLSSTTTSLGEPSPYSIFVLGFLLVTLTAHKGWLGTAVERYWTSD